MTHHDAKNVDGAIVNTESFETMTKNQSDEENTEIVVRMARAQGENEEAMALEVAQKVEEGAHA